MYEDAQTQLWSAAALTSTAVSTNCYDCGAPFTAGGVQPDPSIGQVMGVELTVGVAADHTTGDETYEFDIITATASDLTTGQLIIAQYVLLYSDLTAGAKFFLPIPQGRITQRYLGAKYIGGGTTPTVTVTAWITSSNMSERQKYYSTAITVN